MLYCYVVDKNRNVVKNEITYQWEDSGETLPSWSTMTPPPDTPLKPGEYLAIENWKWEIKMLTIEEVRQDRLVNYNAWEVTYLNQPFIYDGDVYPNDTKFKEMMNSSISAYTAWGRLPKLWVSATKKVVSPVTKEFLNGLGEAAYGYYENNVEVAVKLLASIKQATSIEELLAIEYPEARTVESLVKELGIDTQDDIEDEDNVAP